MLQPLVLLGVVLLLQQPSDAVASVGPRPPATHLDPATGEIGGRVAVAVLPARFEDGKLVEVLAPVGFEAHLASVEDPGTELVYPCGEWFQPPRGRYRVWAAGEGLISRYTTVLSYGGGPFRGRGLMGLAPVEKAGRVVMPPDAERRADLVLRLLHAGSYLEGDVPRRELVRYVPTEGVGEAGVLMPVGRTIGGLWDEREGRYVALSRPFQVAAGKRVEAPLGRPGEGAAHVVVQLRRHRGARSAQDYDTDLELIRGGEARGPDVNVHTATFVYAIWYDYPTGQTKLQGGSQEYYLEPQVLELRPGETARVLGRLEPVLRFEVEPDR